MKLDTGTMVIIASVLIFYIRLIIIQQQRAKQAAHQPRTRKNKSKGQAKSSRAPTKERNFLAKYSILSQNPRDLSLAGVGVTAILLGVLMNLNLIPWAQAYWWAPLAAGILLFSFAFK